MPDEVNALGQPIGAPLPGWKPPPPPPREALEGRFCRLEPLDAARHAESLYRAYQLDTEGRNWTYLAYGPFPTLQIYHNWVVEASAGEDPLLFAIVDKATGRAVGVAGYLRIQPSSGVIEIGHIHYSPLLQRTPAATEAISLMMARIFALGYRRCEWKCDALNAASRAAALRLGMTFEGIFRQATHYKGRNRDTAWFAVIDRDWPRLDAAFRRWLDPSNFDADGKQKTRLAARLP